MAVGLLQGHEVGLKEETVRGLVLVPHWLCDKKISFHFYWNSPITAPTLIKEIAVPTLHLKDLHMMVDEKNNNFDVNTDCIWKLVSQRQFFKVMGRYQWQVTPENVYLKSQKQARAELNELSHRYSFHSEGAPFISYQNHRS